MFCQHKIPQEEIANNPIESSKDRADVPVNHLDDGKGGKEKWK